MKQKPDFKLLAIFVGGLLFTLLFWMEQAGVNLILYSLFVVLALALDKGMQKTGKFWLLASLHLLAGLLVIYNQSGLSQLTWYLSLAVFVGFAHAQLIRSVITAIVSFKLQLLVAPYNFVQRLIRVRIGNFSLKPLAKPIKYIVLPIAVLILFAALYSNANVVFAKYLNELTNGLAQFFSKIYSFFFADLSLARVGHVILGILFSTGLLLGLKGNGVEAIELKFNEQLERNRKRKKNLFFNELAELFFGSFIKKKMALQTENVVGVLCFTLLNLLLLALNLIDLSTLWLASQKQTATAYAAELHDGTNTLIFSIVLAMLVILYFFNGNLNFYRKNKTLKLLAITWIAQNTFLVLSVALRDHNYIVMYGLTYKRIGVLVFLLLCTTGLATVYWKVAKRKTFFFLFKANGLVWCLLLFICCFVNWDVFIISYNLKNQKAESIDIDHLSELSVHTLPLLDQNRKLLSASLKDSQYWPNTTNQIAATANKTIEATNELSDQAKAELAFNRRLNHRIENFKEHYDSVTWLSWNYRNWQTHNYFEQKH